MAIIVKDSFEPLSDRSFGTDQDPLLVTSEATRVLRQELLRYCQGHVAGRSFLIAGHRGAGKTTLVNSAVLEILREAPRAEALRPVLILLHGPNLFPSPNGAPEPPKNGASSDDKSTAQADAKDVPAGDGAAAASPPKSDAQVALEQITLGLHRAVTREYARCYYQRITDLVYLRRQLPDATAVAHFAAVLDREQEVRDGGLQRIPSPDRSKADAARHLKQLMTGLAPDVELYQAAAQFESELYDAPSPARLLEFYRLAGAESGGVLFQQGQVQEARGPWSVFSGLRDDSPATHEQGARELVVLASVTEAYRRISGQYTRTDDLKDLRTENREQTFAAGGAIKEVITPIAALLTGSAAASGLAAASQGFPMALAGGFLTALAATLVMKVSTTRKRDRTLTRDYRFVFDLSVSTLDRVLPILIERLRRAGLAPVFVVDELDKVKGLGERMLTMVHHLKKLVAENAFFCFLTDRSYYEEMVAANVTRQYSVEYTYFGQRLFVVYSPEDFERYLRERIPDPEAAPPPAGAPPMQGEQDPVLVAERAACAVIRWALRHRAQLHVLDLQREVAALHDRQGRITADPAALAAFRQNAIDVTFQVAIELRLAQPELQQAANVRPEFRRLLHDALYYPSRQWLKGESDLDLTWDTGYPAFETYLTERAEREREAAAASAGSGSAATKPSKPFTTGESEFLFEQVRAAADFLSERPSPDPTQTAQPGATPTDWRRTLLTDWDQARATRGLPALEASVKDILLVGSANAILRGGPEQFQFGYLMGRTRAQAPAAVTPPPAGSPIPAPPQPAQPIAPAGPSEPAPTSTGEAVPAPPPVVPAGPATSGARDVAPGVPDAWQEQGAFIRRFARAVLEMQVQPGVDADSAIKHDTGGDLVPLSVIQTRYCVIGQTPSFEIVDKALERLDDASKRGTPHPSFEEDVFHVHRFHEMVRRGAGLIGGAIVCAKVIGRSTRRPGGGLARSLAILSQAYAFESLGEADVRIALENCMVQIERELRIALDLALLSVEPGDLDPLATFVDRVRSLSDRQLPVQVPQSSDVVKLAWAGAHRRLGRWAERGDPGAPELMEIMAAIVGDGPSRFVAFDPRRISAPEWTRVLVSIRERQLGRTDAVAPPAWLGLFAVYALGFNVPPAAHGSLLDWVGLPIAPDAEDRATKDLLLNGQLLTSNSGAEALVFVIRRTSSPLFGRVMPRTDAGDRTFATIVATAAEMSTLLEHRLTDRPLPWLASAPRNGVAVEMPLEDDKAVERILHDVKVLLGETKVLYVYAEDRGRSMNRPNVVKPRNLEAVVKSVR